MQSNTFKIRKDMDSMYEILKEVEKCAEYTGMERRNTFSCVCWRKNWLACCPVCWNITKANSGFPIEERDMP